MISRSSGGMSAARARSMVVFPIPVPPQMMRFFFAWTAPRNNSRRAMSSIPRPMRSSGVTFRNR